MKRGSAASFQIPIQPSWDHTTLGKLLNPSVPQFPHRWKGMNCCKNLLVKLLQDSKCSVNVNLCYSLSSLQQMHLRTQTLLQFPPTFFSLYPACTTWRFGHTWKSLHLSHLNIPVLKKNNYKYGDYRVITQTTSLASMLINSKAWMNKLFSQKTYISKTELDQKMNYHMWNKHY